MRYKFFLIFVLTFTLFSVYAQKETDEPVYILVDKIPEYSDGGVDGLRKHVMKNFRTPDIKGKLSGEIITEFIVEVDGSISDIKIVQDPGHGLGDEVIRILKKTKKWIPAIKGDKYVRYKNVFPLKININDVYINKY